MREVINRYAVPRLHLSEDGRYSFMWAVWLARGHLADIIR